MTELLFYGAGYLVLGSMVTLFLRFRGIPDVWHMHTSDCYGMQYDTQGIGRRGVLTCRGPKLGGVPFELVLWAIWTLFWPALIILMALVYATWFVVKGLWIKV